MQLKEIIRSSALYLGLSDVSEYLENGGECGEETLKTLNIMTRLGNLIISELASTYVPMLHTENISSVSGKIYFTALTFEAVKILKAETPFGDRADFKIFPEYMELKDGVYSVTYEYIPSNYGITDVIGYKTGDVPACALSYGLCAEYCLTQCRFEEAVSWRKRFIQAMEKFLTPKSRVAKGRAFI